MIMFHVNLQGCIFQGVELFFFEDVTLSPATTQVRLHPHVPRRSERLYLSRKMKQLMAEILQKIW